MAAILAQAVQTVKEGAQIHPFGGADAAAALRAFFRQHHAWLSQLLAQLAGHQTDDAFMERRITDDQKGPGAICFFQRRLAHLFAHRLAQRIEIADLRSHVHEQCAIV